MYICCLYVSRRGTVVAHQWPGAPLVQVSPKSRRGRWSSSPRHGVTCFQCLWSKSAVWALAALFTAVVMTRLASVTGLASVTEFGTVPL
jgi:hypothetical protein